jgi:ribosome-binding protein aMBF1 (putative translation factor)
MDSRQRLLRDSVSSITQARVRQHARSLARDEILQQLIADLTAARTAAGLTQEDVAARMWTTKSAVSRLESGTRNRPTLHTIEKYALAVGAQLEVRIRWRG